MFFSAAITDVNELVKATYNIDELSIPCHRIREIYEQFYCKQITMVEAAENIHGIMLDTGFITDH